MTEEQKKERDARNEANAYPEHPSGEVYLYGCQRLSYMNWHKQQVMKQQEKDNFISTYNSEYLDSVVLPEPITDAQQHLIKDQKERSNFLTKRGFELNIPTEPGKFATLDTKPSQARIDELSEAWQEPGGPLALPKRLFQS
eukprot:470832_1